MKPKKNIEFRAQRRIHIQFGHKILPQYLKMKIASGLRTLLLWKWWKKLHSIQLLPVDLYRTFNNVVQVLEKPFFFLFFFFSPSSREGGGADGFNAKLTLTLPSGRKIPSAERITANQTANEKMRNFRMSIFLSWRNWNSTWRMRFVSHYS